MQPEKEKSDCKAQSFGRKEAKKVLRVGAEDPDALWAPAVAPTVQSGYGEGHRGIMESAT